MMTSTRLILTLFAATLASCGGGGGGGGGTTGGGTTPPVTDLVKGTVADGYLRGVTVFWDCDGDRMRGPTEIATTSGAGGAFSIAAAPSAACRLTAQVPVGAIDEDRPGQPVSRPYVMTTPPGSEAFISPLTTMVATQMAQSPGQSQADARASVAQLLGLTEGKVTSNYVQDISADAQRAGQVAQVVRVALQNNNARVQPEVGLAAAQEAVAAMQPPLRNQTFASQTALDTFLDGQLNFFHLSSAPQFVPLNTDLVKVRPNTALSLTTQQQQVLQSVIDDPTVKAVTRFGIINWQDLPLSEFEAVLAKMQGRGLLGQETPAVLALRATRNAELQKWNDYYAANLQSKNKFFASDRAANLKFISSTSLATLEAIDAVLVGADKTGVYVKGSAALKKSIGIGNASGPERIRAGVMLLLSSMDLGAQTLANLDAASRLPDNQELSKDQKDAVIDMVKVLSDYVKVVARNRNWKGLIAKAGPALKLWEFGHDCTGVDVGQASWAECGAAALTVMEMAAEHLNAGHLVRGIIQGARAGFDAYVAGEEYAKVTDKEVYGSFAEVQAEWDAATKQLLLIYKFEEYQLGAYQQYFEAYLPGAYDGQAGESLNSVLGAMGQGVYLPVSPWDMDGFNGIVGRHTTWRLGAQVSGGAYEVLIDQQALIPQFSWSSFGYSEVYLGTDGQWWGQGDRSWRIKAVGVAEAELTIGASPAWRYTVTREALTGTVDGVAYPAGSVRWVFTRVASAAMYQMLNVGNTQPSFTAMISDPNPQTLAPFTPMGGLTGFFRAGGTLAIQGNCMKAECASWSATATGKWAINRVFGANLLELTIPAQMQAYLGVPASVQPFFAEMTVGP